MKVCTSEQMRLIDKKTEEIAGIPSIVLMENAAISCVSVILKEENLKKVLIFCGKGNNGGDGFAIARHLYSKGIDVEVVLVCGSEFQGDALTNFEIISRLGLKITEIDDTHLLNDKIKNSDVIVDAIFGTGISGEINGIAKEVIESINLHSKKVISVDIPSGVNADTGEICRVSVKADVTVTFACYKLGMLTFPGADFVGEIIVADISIPEYIISDENININITDKEDVQKIYPKRERNSHKGDYGKVLIIGGSKGLTGAVTMAADSCVKSGAGLVTVAVPKDLNDILEVKLTEPMTMPLASKNGALDKSSVDKIKEIINNYDVCLFGPGIGRDEDIKDILKGILDVSQIPVIIDADGLYALSQNLEIIEHSKCNIILTPHEMEMSRLSKSTIEFVKKNRIALSESFSVNNGLTLILKGANTIVTTPRGVQYINISGNCGMATGGSGDVLAGMLAAFLARGLNECDSSRIAVYLHGLSGDIAARKLGFDSLKATDIIKNIPNAILKVSE